jgi:hypothetical protein
MAADGLWLYKKQSVKKDDVYMKYKHCRAQSDGIGPGGNRTGDLCAPDRRKKGKS